MKNQLGCPMGSCRWCDAKRDRETPRRCPNAPAPITSFASDTDALLHLVSRPESILCLGVITGAALNDWVMHGEPFWFTVGLWAAAVVVSLGVLAVLFRLAAWRDRWRA